MWRCPVTWCTVWKGTAQDCVDHMRRTHDIPPVVKVANLARWFPPCTVTREQWTSMTQRLFQELRLTLCCSAALGYRCSTAIGSSIIGNSWGFPGHAFLEESDATSLRRRHDGALRTLRHGCHGHCFGTRKTGWRMSFVCRPPRPVRGAGSSRTTGSVRPHRS